MTILVHNTAEVARKYIRFLKWKLYRMKYKFSNIRKAEIFVKAQGGTPKSYGIILKIWIGQRLLVFKKESENIKTTLKNLLESLESTLSNTKKKRTEKYRNHYPPNTLSYE